MGDHQSLAEFCTWLVCHSEALSKFMRSKADARIVMAGHLREEDQELLLEGNKDKITERMERECQPPKPDAGKGAYVSLVHATSLVMPTN
jgi:hypothetical protein